MHGVGKLPHLFVPVVSHDYAPIHKTPRSFYTGIFLEYHFDLKMKRRILFLVALFFAFVPLLAIQKPLFMLYHYDRAAGFAFGDWLSVIGHGLTLDMTVAGYLTCIPLLIVLISIWRVGKLWKHILRGYIIVIAALLGLIFAADLALYSFWDFRLDASIWFYLRSPKDAAASIEWGLALRQIAIAIVYGFCFYFCLNRWILPIFDGTRSDHRIVTTAIVLFSGGLLILPIRGGLSASTANVGRVYFSSEMFLNHAAVNPAFSLFYSSLHQQNYAEQYTYMDESERTAICSSLLGNKDNHTEPLCDTLLTTQRPNIVLVILESFSANASIALDGTEDGTPNLDRLAAEGILFTNFYANSFRTDRGLVSILNAFPGQPTSSIMKYPEKSRSLASIASSLKTAGYSTAVYYGGDIDFTNMRSYFYGSGYERVIGQDGLRGKIDGKVSQWGYDDRLMFDCLAEEVELSAENHRPFFITFLTLSSHEPFDVPFEKFPNSYLNSVAFTDDCIGTFVERLRNSSLWDDTLLILLSDHSYRYPDTVAAASPEHQHIPMVWGGGAIAKPRRIDRLGTQTDLAATLLHQLGLSFDAFGFSRDLLCGGTPDFAFYTYNNGFGYIDSSGITVWNCASSQPVDNRGEGGSERIRKGQALLQTLMEEFDRR